MNFEKVLMQAKEGDSDAILEIIAAFDQKCDCEWQV